MTLAAATSNVVPNIAIKGTSIVTFSPQNATAALTLRTSGLFVTAQTSGVGFTLSTQSGAPVGGEIFYYQVFNPT